MGTKPGQSHSLMRSREIVTAFIPVRLHAQGPCQKKQKGKKNTHRHDKAKIEAMTRNKPLHTNSWAIKKLQVPIPGRLAWTFQLLRL